MSAFDVWRPNASRPYNDLEEAFNAGRALGKKEGMDRAAEIVENSHHTAGNVFEALAEAIRKEIK